MQDFLWYSTTISLTAGVLVGLDWAAQNSDSLVPDPSRVCFTYHEQCFSGTRVAKCRHTVLNRKSRRSEAPKRLRHVGFLSIAPTGLNQPVLYSVIRNLRVEGKSFEEAPQLRITVAATVRIAKANSRFQTLGWQMAVPRRFLPALAVECQGLELNTPAFADPDV